MIKNLYNHKARFLCSIAMIFFIITQAVSAQETGSISGRVTDKKTGEQLVGANIVVKGTNQGAASDIDGHYKIPDVSAGAHVLVISYVGYQGQTINVNITASKTTEVNIKLAPQAVEGKEVVVTAQAAGQLSAINQQLSSNNIVNVVSSEKMQQLPDANIAESIGRLPGISLQRNAGEAYAVVIRGLSPKYNEVMIEGVPMTSTNYSDRSVDLSLLSDNLVKGVEVSKTLQANMDANALGGTVNLTLRTADPGLHYSIWANGGYNHLRDSYKNYKFAASIGDRFFNNKFGILVLGDIEEKQLPSDQFNATYASPTNSATGFSISTSTAELTDNSISRHRYGISAILDYTSDLVDIKFYNIFDQKNDSTITRDYTSEFTSNAFNDQLFINETKTLQETHSLQALFKLGGTELPVSLSYTKGRQNVPNGLEFDITTPSANTISPSQLVYGQPSALIHAIGVVNPANSVLSNLYINNTNLTDEQYDARIDWKVPFKLSDGFSGQLSVGGKYQAVDRTSDATRKFLYIQYGNGATNRRNLIASSPLLTGTNPNLAAGVVAYPFVDQGYTRTSILGYPIGPWSGYKGTGFNVYELADLQNNYYAKNADSYWQDAVNSYNQIYTDKEYTSAGYIMGEFNIGNNLTIVPGIRYQDESTNISAYHIEVNLNNQNGLQSGQNAVVPVNSKRNFPAWYPSVNVKFKAADNIQIQGAIYKSESLPSYGEISPLLQLEQGTQIVTGNPLLQPSTAWNYDLSVSLFNNTIGLLSIDGFYKDISNLIYAMQNYVPFYNLSGNPYTYNVVAPAGFLSRLPSLEYFASDPAFIKNIGGYNLTAAIPINDPENAYLRGISISWQTHLWYLPGVLSGVVLDLNATFMSSNQEYPSFNVVKTGGTVFNPIYTMEYQTVGGALQNQPDAIYNAIIGWDYGGFSARVSFRYQGLTLTSMDTRYGLEDSYYDNVLLTDISVKQSIIDGLSLFANATNINNHIDNYYFSHPTYTTSTITYPAGDLPTSGQTYGWAIELGATYRY